jgi:hypothetical protein
MKKPAGKKKAATKKPAVPEKRSSLKKNKRSSKKEDAKKKVKAKQTARTAAASKKKKAATKSPAKTAEKTKKPSRAKKAVTEPLKPVGKSSAEVKTSKRRTAGKSTAKRTAAKTATKKPVKKTSKRIPSAADRPPKKKPVPVKAGKIARPDAGMKMPEAVATRELPLEYGENEVILMPVDPDIVFVDWEIRKEDIPAADTTVTMRVFDVTADHAAPVSPEKRFFEVKLEGRTGCGFFDIGMPGREVAVQIGLQRNGTFLAILVSRKVSMPELVAFDELGIAQALPTSGIKVGY